MHQGIEQFFPVALGVVLLLLLTGALFTMPIPVVVLLSGTTFFAGGMVFGRREEYSAWGAGITLLLPVFLTSAFLVVKFGVSFLAIPALAAGGVAAGVAARRRAPRGAGAFLLGAAWFAFVAVIALLLLTQS
jgi:hypothetical protein